MWLLSEHSGYEKNRGHAVTKVPGATLSNCFHLTRVLEELGAFPRPPAAQKRSRKSSGKQVTFWKATPLIRHVYACCAQSLVSVPCPLYPVHTEAIPAAFFSQLKWRRLLNAAAASLDFIQDSDLQWRWKILKKNILFTVSDSACCRAGVKMASKGFQMEQVSSKVKFSAKWVIASLVKWPGFPH